MPTGDPHAEPYISYEEIDPINGVRHDSERKKEVGGNKATPRPMRGKALGSLVVALRQDVGDSPSPLCDQDSKETGQGESAPSPNDSVLEHPWREKAGEKNAKADTGIDVPGRDRSLVGGGRGG